MLNYYDNYNVFAANNKYISVIGTIEPKLFLFDFNLNLIDSINFAADDSYKYCIKDLNYNLELNKNIVNPQYPKNIIMILDKMKIHYNYYSNVKHKFVNDSTLLIVTTRHASDTADLIEFNINNKSKKGLLSFPKYNNASPYSNLLTYNITTDGLLFYNTEKADEEKMLIKYYLNSYYSPLLDFSKVIELENIQAKKETINLNNYDNIIISDTYLCKNCFKNRKSDKFLFIVTNKTTKTQKIGIYNKILSIYPNATVMFKSNVSKYLKKNVILSDKDIKGLVEDCKKKDN